MRPARLLITALISFQLIGAVPAAEERLAGETTAAGPAEGSGASCSDFRLYSPPVMNDLIPFVYRESKKPGWAARWEIGAEEWRRLTVKEKLSRIHELISRQACEARRGAEKYVGWLARRSYYGRRTYMGRPFYRKRDVCEWSEPLYAVKVRFLEEAAELRSTLTARHPYGVKALEHPADPSPRFSEVPRVERTAKARLIEVRRMRSECDSVRKGLKRELDSSRRMIGDMAKRLESRGDAAGLRGLYDGGVGPSGTFEELTDGIVLKGFRARTRSGRVSASRVEAAAKRALRQIYELSEGKKVLADLQKARRGFGENHRWNQVNLAREISFLKQSIAAVEKAMPAAARSASPHMRRYIRDTRRAIERNTRLLALLKARRGEKPKVYVEIGRSDMTGGLADPGTLFVTPDGEPALRIRLGKEFLEDTNPARALNPIMAHEMRHIADSTAILAYGYSRLSWHVFEDRAYLTEARLVMEQHALLKAKGEPPSRFLDALKRHHIEDLASRPESYRLDKLSSPAYLWNVTLSDLEDPDAALRTRLLWAYDWMPRNGRPPAYPFDRGGQLAAALKQAEAEAGPFDSAVKLRFIELAEGTPMALYWLDALKRLKEGKSEIGRPDMFRDMMIRKTRQYIRELADFHRRYGKGD